MKFQLIFHLVIALIVCSCKGHKRDTETKENAENKTEVAYDSLLAKKYEAYDYGMKLYVMAFLKKGPNRDKTNEESEALQRAHLDNIGRLANEGKLVLAGVAELGDAADRNHSFWNKLGRYVWPNAFVGDTYDEEIDYFKAWVSARLEWMDINMPSDCDLAIGIDENLKAENETEISVYPNPFTERIYLENTFGTIPQSINIFDGYGKLVKSVFPASGTSILEIEVDDLSKGIYFI